MHFFLDIFVCMFNANFCFKQYPSDPRFGEMYHGLYFSKIQSLQLTEPNKLNIISN